MFSLFFILCGILPCLIFPLILDIFSIVGEFEGCTLVFFRIVASPSLVYSFTRKEIGNIYLELMFRLKVGLKSNILLSLTPWPTIFWWEKMKTATATMTILFWDSLCSLPVYTSCTIYVSYFFSCFMRIVIFLCLYTSSDAYNSVYMCGFMINLEGFIFPTCRSTQRNS